MPPEEEHRIEVHLDRLLAQRGITLTDLAAQVGITLANQPGDLFTVVPAK